MTPKQRFIKTCRCEPVDRPPVWMMRQAGRYLPEYRALRDQHRTLEMMRTPKIAAEITLQPVTRLGVDAAILYSDILILPDALGLGLEFREGEGPVFNKPVRTEDDVNRLWVDRVESGCAFVPEAIRLIRKDLPADFPLLGFAGAPLTVAHYMIGARGSNDGVDVKRFCLEQPAVFEALLTTLVDTTIRYLKLQVEAGVDAIQLFDTWAGTFSAPQYRAWAMPYSRRVIRAVQDMGVPVILYIKGGAHLLDDMLASGADVVSLDWRVDPKEARKKSAGKVALQGNFDPAMLYASPEQIAQMTEEMMDAFGDAPGHIVNLGHGILPTVPVENAQAFIDTAKRIGAA